MVGILAEEEEVARASQDVNDGIRIRLHLSVSLACEGTTDPLIS